MTREGFHPAIEPPPGRFYFWSQRALYIGPSLSVTVHAHHAVQVFLPLSASIRLRSGPGTTWCPYQGAVVASNQPHAALLYVFAALDPVKNIAVIQAVIILYVVHAGYELACSSGLAPPGKPPFRPKQVFLVEGLVLLGVIFPIVVFYPWGAS